MSILVGLGVVVVLAVGAYLVYRNNKVKADALAAKVKADAAAVSQTASAVADAVKNTKL